MNAHNSRARAHANLALVKYFGKRDLALNLPAAGSLSLTLKPLTTTTHIAFEGGIEKDVVKVNGALAEPRFSARVSRFLDIVRGMAGSDYRASVETRNDFPTAAGLASSASGFAALALASTDALGLCLDEAALSALARRGSGSAARSITGGISVWRRGESTDGSDSFARTIAEPKEWDLRVVVGVTDPGAKKVGSTEAMERTRETSPYYNEWIRSAEHDLEEATDAVNERDFMRLGEITERSALAMHAAAIAARPGIVYWNGATLEAFHAIRALRENGLEVYFTCDAGPQPKVLTLPENVVAVEEMLMATPGVTRTIRCELGEGARLISE